MKNASAKNGLPPHAVPAATQSALLPPPSGSLPASVSRPKDLVKPMGQAAALNLCAVMSTIWDARPWSDEKMALFSKSIADLDYVLASRAIDNLIKQSKWQPTPAEVRTEHDILLRRAFQEHQFRVDRQAQRLLTGPDARDADGKLVALVPIRETLKRLQDKVSMNPPRGLFAKPGATENVDDATLQQREQRRRVMLEQARRLRES